MKKINDFIKQDSIEFKAFKCMSCGEEIVTMKQLKVLADKYRRLRNAKEITFAKWGNSIAARIPRDITNRYKITPGKRDILIKDKKSIKIIPT